MHQNGNLLGRALSCGVLSLLLVTLVPHRASAATLTPWTSVWGPTPTGGLYLGAADKSGLAGGNPNGYAAFSIGGSFSSTDTINGTSDNSSGNSYYNGDLGVAGNYTNAGSSTQAYNAANKSKSSASLSYSTLNGQLVLDNGLVYTSTSSTISSGVVQNTSSYDALAQGVFDAVNAAKQANSFAQTTGFTTTGLTISTSGSPYSSISLSGATGGVNLNNISQTVIKLQNFTLNSGSTFTLTGTASTRVIIDVYGTFSLQNASKIQLAGGLQWENVLWNVYGLGSDVTLSGGSSMDGYLMAMQRNVMMSGSTLNGQAIVGGQQLVLSSGSKINKPPKVSP
jgi:hypothetical protein